MSNRLIPPGTAVTQSGIYLAIHKGHREPHEILFLAGEQFPNCNTCDSSVRYKLKQAAPHIRDDEDFR
jgi:hypothetical protein